MHVRDCKLTQILAPLLAGNTQVRSPSSHRFSPKVHSCSRGPHPQGARRPCAFAPDLLPGCVCVCKVFCVRACLCAFKPVHVCVCEWGCLHAGMQQPRLQPPTCSCKSSARPRPMCLNTLCPARQPACSPSAWRHSACPCSCTCFCAAHQAVLLAVVSGAPDDYQDTLNTLRMATRAATIKVLAPRGRAEPSRWRACRPVQLQLADMQRRACAICLRSLHPVMLT